MTEWFCHVTCFSKAFLLFTCSCPVVFCKKGVLQKFAKFTGKHLGQSLFFNKVAGLRPVCISDSSEVPQTYKKITKTIYNTKSVYQLM